MGAPTVLAYGSEELKQKHLRKIFTGEDVWCQLFSEPTHGSDVAGIPSRAVRDGDEWIVNGQKVWTTLAHTSNYGMLLTRTNPDIPKHKGLSYFVLDMHAPGVEVRPLYQMTGEAEFNEVFLTDVRIDDSLRLGDEGDGWRVAITTLMNERVALAGGPAPRGSGPIKELVKLWEERKSQLSSVECEIWRDRVMALWIEAEIVRLTNARAKQSAVGGNPGPEGSVSKLASAELSKRVTAAVVDLEGAAGMVHEPGYPMTRSSEGMSTRTGRFLRARANTIEGGTSEIMRNILGERVLGLPGDIRVDTDVPWSEIPK
jgi:alkylation response protein AidB-like acyl-CoA dehydrogenase